VPLLRLAEPLAPAVAAERAGVPVNAEEIEQRIDACAAKASRWWSKAPAV
jgi:dethiobiotin synthetase